MKTISSDALAVVAAAAAVVLLLLIVFSAPYSYTRPASQRQIKNDERISYNSTMGINDTYTEYVMYLFPSTNAIPCKRASARVAEWVGGKLRILPLDKIGKI